MDYINVNWDRVIGNIKPVHGVNNGPVTCNFWYDSSERFVEAKIPYCRLHDTEYPFGNGEFVDVGCIFKDFSADENDPEAYNFALTDDYLRCIKDVGAKIVYRLGASIEHQEGKCNIVVPDDFEKYARICANIIRHYNEGWANGHNWNIEYWEIWNEPDVVIGKTQRNWTGTKEEFFDFYETVARYLKKEFPYLKIGGAALTAPAHDFAQDFLEFVVTKIPRVPLDFFSWHGYLNNVDQARENAEEADRILKKYGLTETESIYDEWNYVCSWNNMESSYKEMRSMKGAALCAGVLCELQHSPVDKAMYYDAQLKFEDEWCGLFVPGKVHRHAIGTKVIPLKPFYSFKAFGVLYGLRQEVETKVEGRNLYVCAAVSGKEKALLLSSFENQAIEGKKVRIQWGNIILYTEVYLLDEAHDLELIMAYRGADMELEVKPNTVYLLRFYDKD